MNPKQEADLLNTPAFLSPLERQEVVKLIQEFCTLEHLFYVRNRIFEMFRNSLQADEKADCIGDNYSTEFWHIFELVRVVEACYLLRDQIRDRSIVIHE
jgi:hypothetical protein